MKYGSLQRNNIPTVFRPISLDTLKNPIIAHFKNYALQWSFTSISKSLSLESFCVVVVRRTKDTYRHIMCEWRTMGKNVAIFICLKLHKHDTQRCVFVFTLNLKDGENVLYSPLYFFFTHIHL